MRRMLVWATTLVLGVAVAQFVTLERRTERSDPGAVAAAHSAALRTFGACDEALDHLRHQALDRVGPWGLEGYGYGGYVSDGLMPLAAEAGLGDSADAAAGTQRAGASVAGEDHSTTNVQEVGVDEPDLVKTDGTFVYSVMQGRLRVLDVTGDAPVVVHEEPTGDGWGQELLLAGDRLLVLGSGAHDVAVEPLADAARGLMLSPVLGMGATTATLYDVSDPRSPILVEELEVEGWRVAARMIDGVARLVVRSDPAGLPWAFPLEGGPEQERAATAANRAAVTSSTLSDWLPTVVRTDHAASTPVTIEAPLTACDRIHHPAEFSGFGSLSVLSLDLHRGFADTGAATVLAGGDTVYASATSLYVATTRWVQTGVEPLADASGDEVPFAVGETRTDLHVFDITDPAGTLYRGSGSVPGHLLNQFSMSEHEGHLRVATTVEQTAHGLSESAVHVLRLEEDRLVEVASVGGLGRDERIYAVRYLGDVAYVVTFRETDPLYTVDLSDPTAPKVRGELKILGYSAYLHPVGDGLVLGIGQDATEQGQTLGTQVSLFDVSDLDAPRRVANTTVQQGYSDAEYDHHAFLWWAPTGMAMLPVSTWSGTGSWSGAIGFRVDTGAGKLDRIGQVSHDLLAPGAQPPPVPESDALVEETGFASEELWVPPIVRSVVIDGSVFTFSELGLVVADLDTLEVESSLAW